MSDERAARRRQNRADAKAQKAMEWEEREIEREWEIDPQWKAYVTHIRQEVAPKVQDSAMTISIVPKPEDVDVKFAVELGMSIMFDKPLIMCVPHDSALPEHLLRVADHIVRGNPADPGVREALLTAINAVGASLGEDWTGDDDEAGG